MIDLRKTHIGITVNEFTDEALKAFQSEFLELECNGYVPVIVLHISTYGGDVYNLLAMVDIITHSTKPVYTIGVGKVMSAGVPLLASGHARYMLPNCTAMLHHAHSFSVGNHNELHNDYEELNRLNTLILDLLAEKCKKSKNFFHNYVENKKNLDVYMTAEECVKCGIVDHIGLPSFSLDVSVNNPEKAKNRATKRKNNIDKTR